jgi:hypothetical protein
MRASRALGETYRSGDQEHTQDVGQRELALRHGERTARERPVERVGQALAAVGLGQRSLEFLERRQHERLLDHPRHGAFGLADDPQTPVGGDPEVGEPQDECGGRGGGHGHVVQAGPADVTVWP